MRISNPRSPMAVPADEGAARPMRAAGAPARRFALGSRRLAPYVFLAPTLVLSLIIVVYPLLNSFVQSFYNWNLMKPGQGRAFVGLANYVEVLTSAKFWDALRVTVTLMAGMVTVELALGMAIALLLNRHFPGKQIVRSAILLPLMLPHVVVGLIWRYMWEARFGVINYLLTVVGLPPQPWLARPDPAVVAVVLTDVWLITPFVFLVFLAGLQALPEEFFEAAKIDGAGRWAQFRYVTIPLMIPVILVVLVIRIMDSIRAFDLIYVMTDGGPANATTNLFYLTYQTTFRFWEIGSGAALSTIMVGLIVLFSVFFIARLQAERQD
jgi:multiple sugar transport system permease protein